MTKYAACTPEQQAKLERVDLLEAAFAACAHQYTEPGAEWCNVCGAYRIDGRGAWFQPHWRDILICGWDGPAKATS